MIKKAVALLLLVVACGDPAPEDLYSFEFEPAVTTYHDLVVRFNSEIEEGLPTPAEAGRVCEVHCWNNSGMRNITYERTKNSVVYECNCVEPLWSAE